MPHRRFDWHQYIKEVEREYKASRLAVDRLRSAATADPTVLNSDEPTRANLRAASENLHGTYLVRLFAAFEAALRSFYRASCNDPTAAPPGAAVLIDTIGGKRGAGISQSVRQDAQAVRAAETGGRTTMTTRRKT